MHTLAVRDMPWQISKMYTMYDVHNKFILQQCCYSTTVYKSCTYVPFILYVYVVLGPTILTISHQGRQLAQCGGHD